MQALAARPSRATRVIVPIERLDRAALYALAYARTVSDDVTAVHVAGDDRVEEMRLRERWRHTDDGTRLEVLVGGEAVEAIASYVEGLPGTSAVVIPEVMPRPRWLYPLHNLGTLALRRRLAAHASAVVISAPYRLSAE